MRRRGWFRFGGSGLLVLCLPLLALAPALFVLLWSSGFIGAKLFSILVLMGVVTTVWQNWPGLAKAFFAR